MPSVLRYTLLLTAQASGRGYYDPSDFRENLLEYFGVALAFALSVLVIWLLIRKDLKEERRGRGDGATRGQEEERGTMNDER